MKALFNLELKKKKTVTLYNEDCLKGLDSLEKDSVSVCVTSPPYNLGIKYSKYDDTIPRDEYLAWIDSWAQKLCRVLEPSGSLFLNVGSSLKDPWIAMDVAKTVSKSMKLQNVIHWIKSISIDKEFLKSKHPGAKGLSVGHYKPINSKRFLNDCHEYVYHFTLSGTVEIERKSIGVPYQDKSNIARWNSVGGDRRCRGNNWFIPYSTIMNRKKDRPHPATFPEKLVENCLKLHGLKSIKRVIDPFMGIGTTAVVCADLGLNCIGFEIDENYIQEAIHRLREKQNSIF